MASLSSFDHNDQATVTIQVCEIYEPSNEKRAQELRVATTDGESATMVIWNKSSLAEQGWTEGEWYTVKDVLVKRWDSQIQLNATTQTSLKEQYSQLQSDENSRETSSSTSVSRDEFLSDETTASREHDQKEHVETCTGASESATQGEDEVPTVSETLSWLQEESRESAQLEYKQSVPEQTPEKSQVELLPAVQQAVDALGIDALYEHQAQALTAVREGEHVVLSSATASGKSLPYQILAAERAIESNGTTLYIAPMRSLINDQGKSFQALFDELGAEQSLEAAIYDGETPKQERRAIRKRRPRILLMTPELVHQSLLPWSDVHWQWFLRNLDTVVIDEVHHFRGVFGSHLGLILRRLNRIASEYGAAPQYFCCSATIGNPREHASNVTNKPAQSFRVIDEDTSGRGTRYWLFYNPPYKTETDSEAGSDPEYPENWASIRKKVLSRDNYMCVRCGVRGGHYSPIEFHAHHIVPVGRGGTHDLSNLVTLCAECHSKQPGHAYTSRGTPLASSPQDVMQEQERTSHRPVALQLFVELVDRGHQTLVFTRTRQEAERYSVAATQQLSQFGRTELAESIQPYHAALQDSLRTQIESGLQTGDVRGVWATNALELGVDIGGIDAVILSGHPGTTMSLFQRAGRSGRGRDDCLVLLVASRNPLDQYCITHPEQVFEETPGNAAINSGNAEIITDHLVSAADEQPLSRSDEEYFGERQQAVIRELDNVGKLERTTANGQLQWECSVESPQHKMDLRGIADRKFSLIDQARNTTIGELQLRDAVQDCHPDAIYTHHKQKYRVEEFDQQEDEIYLTEYSGSEFTQAISEESLSVNRCVETRTPESLRGVTIGLADVTYRSQVQEYLLMQGPRDENPSTERIDQDLPAFELQTEALYLTVPDRVRRRVQKMTKVEHPFLCSLHGVEHLLMSLFPLEVLCERGDIGGFSATKHDATGQGTIFIFDTVPGGVGLAHTGFDKIERLLERAYEVVINCDCEYGCPSCIHSSRCRSGNRALHKDLTTLALEWLDVPDERKYL